MDYLIRSSVCAIGPVPGACAATTSGVGGVGGLAIIKVLILNFDEELRQSENSVWGYVEPTVGLGTHEGEIERMEIDVSATFQYNKRIHGKNATIEEGSALFLTVIMHVQ